MITFEKFQEYCNQSQFGWDMQYCNELYYDGYSGSDIECTEKNCPVWNKKQAYNLFDVITVNGKEGTIIHIYDDSFEIEFTDDKMIELVKIKDLI